MGVGTQALASKIMIGVMAIGIGLTDVADAQDAGPSAPVVRTLIVAVVPENVTRQFFGRIRARETLDLAFEVGGRLARLVPEEGTRMSAGEPVAELESDGLARAVARAELQLRMATRDAERARVLAGSAAGSMTRAEEAETARDLAEITLEDAREALGDAILRAPFDALVAERLAVPQAMVEPGQPVLRLHDMSEIRVEVDLPERVFAVAGGLEHVAFNARTLQGANLPLRLVAFRPDTSLVGQTYLVTLAFLSDPGDTLLPGASITVTAVFPATDEGMTVPASAVIAGNDRSASVFVIDGDGPTARVQRVEIAIATADGASFMVEGLEGGTEIVAVGAHRLADGQLVRRFEGLNASEQQSSLSPEALP